MKPARTVGLGCLVLLSLPFCAAGLFAFAMAARAALAPSPDWTRVAALGLFGLVFGGVGFGLIAAGKAGAARQQEIDRLRAEAPQAPWRWRKDWSRGYADDASRSTLPAAWGFALFVSLISAGVAAAILKELGAGNRLAALGLVFPAVGLGLLANATVKTWRRLKYGVSRFEMASVPGSPGGRLSGAIRTGFDLSPEDGFSLRLTCASRTSSGSGKNRSVRENILWRDERTMNRALPGPDPAGGSIPVYFEIPADARPTTLDDPDDRVLWTLDADCRVPGLDYHAEFEVPVFPTGDPAPAAGAAPADPMAEYLAPEQPYRPRSDSPIQLRPSAGGGIEIDFPAARNPGAAFSMSAFLLLWCGAIWLQVHLRAPLIFPIIFGLFGLLLLWIALDLWLGTCRVVIEAGEVRVRLGLLGLGPTRIFPCSEIQQVVLRINMQSGGRSGTPYYDIALVRRNGRRIAAGQHLRDKREAEWLAAQIRERLAAAR